MTSKDRRARVIGASSAALARTHLAPRPGRTINIEGGLAFAG